ncbi:SIMPL domain-containing protein [Sphingomonas sp. LB-2]|uniref:SIMPL domain-containing protein n=1 Tax=Sphingomonas caeni TaxID=2984949 RepID=UPI0022313A64|nr:SIMPL domain-containing protein [Sphingomonas caeni]MCW3847784.1 SIMPL domain-containing protein [Sphingomonas caeni]
MGKAAIGLVSLASLALAGCGVPGQQGGPNGLERGETLLQVSATGQAETKPDEANISVGVSSIGATSEAATETNNQKINAVVGALKALGVAEADMQTQQLSVSRIGYGANRNKFEASNTITIRIRDVSKAGAAIQAATRAGANLLSGPDLRVSDPEAANKGAYAAAYKTARARADTYAEAAGLKVVRVLVIRDGGAGAPPQPMVAYESADMVAQRAAPPPVFAGSDRSQVSVSVDFALAPK